MNKTNVRINHYTIIWAMLFLLAVSSVRATEPMYDGKALSEWLVTMKTNPPDAEAIRQMGTNALPTLLDIISVEERNRKKVLGKLKSKDFREVAGNKNVPASVIRGLAVDGFGILSTNAEPAIPQLKEILHSSLECSPEVAGALVRIGPKGFAALTNVIGDQDLARVLVRTISEQGGSDVKTITRILVGFLKNPDSWTRGYAANSLAGKDADLAIPALIEMAKDPESGFQQTAAISLGSYGPAAKRALPQLWSLYTNKPDVFVMKAMQAIDRETAGRAEEFLVNSGPLNEARDGYTRTKLTNGLELIAGGYLHTEIPSVSNRVLSTAQLLDTNTGKWTETGEMHTARDSHDAVLLHNGKVLVAGGSGGKGHYLSSAELYDPITGKWTETGSMNNARLYLKLVLQRDGRVLVAGGHDGHKLLSSNEIYDPSTGTWTVVTNK